MTKRSYIFAGGGTGGHLFPGIAVAQEIIRRHPDSRILFVGSERELERLILEKYPFEHRSLPVESLRMLKRGPVQFFMRNWQAWRNAGRLIRQENPAAIVGLGGYASAPIVWAASRRKVPVVLLEQNSIPGRTTRWLCRTADVVCTSDPDVARQLPRSVRTECTGNPLRSEIAALNAMLLNKPRRDSCVLVLGGSQGAEGLNEAFVEAINLLYKEMQGWRVIHQTGPQHIEIIRDAYQGLSIPAKVQPFFDDMVDCYRNASIVVSRAGASTLAEVASCGLPAILLPYPHAADNHQAANARLFQKHGAAIVVEHLPTVRQTAAKLAVQLRSLLSEPVRRDSMSQAAFSLARPMAAASVVDWINKLSTAYAP